MKQRIKKIQYKDSDKRRIKAIELILANKGKNIQKYLIEAGYSKEYAHNPSDFLNTKEVLKKLDWFKYECEAIKERMDKTRNKAKYKELSDSFSALTKLQQLLGGNPTEIFKITEEEKSAVDKAFKDNE